MKRPLAAPMILAILFLLGVDVAYEVFRAAFPTPESLVGRPLPAVSLADLAGGPRRSMPQVLRGQPGLVNVFASWCGPCAEETPVLMDLRARGARILGVAYRDAPDASANFLARVGDPYAAVLIDADGRAAARIALRGVPETLAIDRAGVVRAVWSGALTEAEAELLLRKAES